MQLKHRCSFVFCNSPKGDKDDSTPEILHEIREKIEAISQNVFSRPAISCRRDKKKFATPSKISLMFLFYLIKWIYFILFD